MSGEGWYHLTSRCVLQQFLFKAEDKEMLVRMARACADFSGIDICAYAVLDNHFHLLVHVPPPSVVPEDEVLRRVGILYGHARRDDMRHRWQDWREHNLGRMAEEELDHLRSRMGDISKFMWILKQRFSLWYRSNAHDNGRIAGTIWQGRFNSTVVEGDIRALAAVAAYIDLNPVRAGIVSDPKDYRWSSYGSACAGVTRAKKGYGLLFSMMFGRRSFLDSMAYYRSLLYCAGAGSFSAEDLKKVIDSHGRLSIEQFVRCHVRYFTAGVAFGSKEFVDMVFADNPDLFSSKRRTGARGIGLCPGWDGFTLCTLRDLRVDAVTHPSTPHAKESK